MTDVRLHTQVRRMRTLKVYTLEPSVAVVPCLSNGIAKEDSFSVRLYLSENNKDRTPFKARIRYTRYNGGLSYPAVESAIDVDVIAVDTGKKEGKVYDKYVIEAYQIDKDKKEKILATANIAVSRDGAQGEAGAAGPMIVPYGAWDAKRVYRSSDDVRVFVERHKMFYVLKKVDVDCVGVDPATDYNNEFWRLMDYYEFIIVNAMVAEFGKIGSAVFSGDYMLSQHGVDNNNQPVTSEHGYENFGKKDENGKDLFTPYALINFLTGYAHFAKKNVVLHSNGDVEIVGNLKAGRLGAFTISKGILNYDTEKEEILDPDAFIRIVREDNNRFSVNEKGRDAICDIRADAQTGMEINADKNNAVCLKLRANAGSNNYTIKSYGDVLLEARNTEKITVHGLCVNTRKIESAGEVIGTNDDFLIFNKNTSNNAVMMPKPSTNSGKVYYCKIAAGSWVFQNGPFRLGNRWQLDATAALSGTIAFMFVSDGDAWNLFYCG